MALPPPSFSNPYDELGRVDPERYRHYIESTISSVPASRSPSPTHSQSRSSSSHSHSHSHFHPHPHPHHRSPSGSPSQAHSRSTSGGARSHLSSITSHADSTDQAHAQALANADANADAGANADLPDYDHAQRTKSGINFAGRDSFSYESSYGIPLPDPIRASVYGALQGTRFGSRAASASAGANTTDRQQRYRPQRPRTADEIAVNAVLNPQELVSAPGSGDMDLDRRRRHVSAQGPGPFLAGGAGGGYASSPRASHPNHLGPRGGGRLVPGFWPPPSDFAAAGGPGPSTEDLVNFQDPSFARPLSFPGFDHRTPSEPGSRADSVDMRNEDAVLHDQQAALRTLISREEEGAGGGAGGAGAGGLPPKTSEEKAPVQLHIYRDTILPGYSFRKRALVARSPSGSRRASGARGQEGKGPGGLEGLEHGENGEEEEEEEVLVARVPRQLSGWKAVLMRAEGLRADTKKKKLVSRFGP